MPKVKLRVNSWLNKGVDANASNFDEFLWVVPEGESVVGLVRRFASENAVFHKAILDEKQQEILSNIVIILNGRIVDPDTCSETALKEGDEVTFGPMLHGG
jgi:molybdopterin converting factor small subunit